MYHRVLHGKLIPTKQFSCYLYALNYSDCIYQVIYKSNMNKGDRSPSWSFKLRLSADRAPGSLLEDLNGENSNQPMLKKEQRPNKKKGLSFLFLQVNLHAIQDHKNTTAQSRLSNNDTCNNSLGSMMGKIVPSTPKL